MSTSPEFSKREQRVLSRQIENAQYHEAHGLYETGRDFARYVEECAGLEVFISYTSTISPNLLEVGEGLVERQTR